MAANKKPPVPHAGIPPQHLRSEAKRQFERAVWDFYVSQQKVAVIVFDETHSLR
jgi:hypothetical protein